MNFLLFSWLHQHSAHTNKAPTTYLLDYFLPSMSKSNESATKRLRDISLIMKSEKFATLRGMITRALDIRTSHQIMRNAEKTCLFGPLARHYWDSNWFLPFLGFLANFLSPTITLGKSQGTSMSCHGKKKNLWVKSPPQFFLLSLAVNLLINFQDLPVSLRTMCLWQGNCENVLLGLLLDH